MSTKKECTLEDLNFFFDYSEHCTSCGEGECHTQLTTEDGHYFIHLLCIRRIGPFVVTIYDLKNSHSEPSILNYSSDSECATYLRDTFGFRYE